ncbi:MAG TPA: peptidoglycan-associated lipoprotein Pal, partial [Steroidobacteraceae bacterium]|nr:peptidoglycan-associated lipoprotein Pal [Steroidobacteraceae bacterium]
RAPAGEPGGEERSAREALEQQGMVILFDYDSSQVRSQYVDLIAAHARYAGRFTTVAVRLEGHTDERGSREYNIGLGDRRAQAVRRAFELQGVPKSRISTISYGEERPAAAGSDEGSWSQNRRVEIRYQP